MKNPYEDLPPRAYWRPSVAETSLFDMPPLWQPKFRPQPGDPIVTFGSCFAQHFGRALKARGYTWLITEPPPRLLSEANRRRFNYEIYSARTGNIYTTSLLAQWVGWAVDPSTCPAEVWEDGGRFYDPFRPAVEPNGFASREELLSSRAKTIECFAAAIRQARYFVFTMGLTESWHDRAGYEYPMCPGTIAGKFDPERHYFDNALTGSVNSSLQEALKGLLSLNRGIKVILTVSPVPLTATNSGNHVVVATTESKSVLRAVAGQFVRRSPVVDYFPSYELITMPATRGMFFGPNQRTVVQAGVDHVMRQFFGALEGGSGTPKQPASAPAQSPKPAKQAAAAPKRSSDVVCEEELLEAFS